MTITTVSCDCCQKHFNVLILDYEDDGVPWHNICDKCGMILCGDCRGHHETNFQVGPNGCDGPCKPKELTPIEIELEQQVSAMRSAWRAERRKEEPKPRVRKLNLE
jgi:hypothetical protein